MAPTPPVPERNTPPGAAWMPDAATAAAANVTALMRDLGVGSYPDLHAWSVRDRAGFWGRAVDRLGIVFRDPYESVVDLSGGVESPRWFPGGTLNITDSCFRAPPQKTAVVYRAGGSDRRLSYAALQSLSYRFANGFVAAGYVPGDRVAIAMPMTVEAVAAYLGIVAAGGVVVSIADSFAPQEIRTRMRITGADTVVTQDRIRRAGRELPMYDKVVAAGARRVIVVDTGAGMGVRSEDCWWADFLSDDDQFTAVAVQPGAHSNILFSSGTTADPKAIPWTHAAPVKAAADGHFHQDIHPDDLVAWPTNLGWMMGPWLIYASLVGRASLALYDDVPTGRGFGEFVASAGVTILGVVPSLVAAWRSSACMEGLDWSRIRLFSSTGEASNAGDMRYLMGLAGDRPVIEYCGGTELAGGYITGTVVQPAIPAAFSTPTLGLDVRILDEEGRPAPEGELFIVPPSIGLSTELLNRDHHDAYYAGTPRVEVPLRRHGDHFRSLGGGYYRAHGRTDDTMNLAGIKVGSAEIERVVAAVDGIAEVAAVAVPPPGGGPERLVVFAVPSSDADLDPPAAKESMQGAIRAELNPLFKIHDVVIVDALPRTASAKVMRRALRAQYAAPGGYD